MSIFKRRKIGKYLPGIFTFSDLLCVNILFAISLLFNPEVSDLPRIRTIWVLVSTSFVPMLFWFYHKPHYHRAMTMDILIKDAFMVVVVHGLFFVSLLAYLDIEIPFREYLTFYSLMGVGVPLWWIISRTILKVFRRRGYNFVRVGIVGTGPMAERLYKELNTDAGFGYKVIGFFSDRPYPEFKGEIIGTIDDIGEKARELNLDQIFYTLSGADEQKLTKVLKICDDNMIQFYYVPQLPRRVLRSFELHRIGGMPLLSIRRNPLSDMLNRTIKRTFDIVFSSIMLILSPPIVLLIVLGIKLSSPGPILFIQDRTGYKGRTFRCWKFRTMRVNDDSERRQATADDPRTTKFGKFMRHASIDELPQFWNVLKGDMSVVGPRPHMLKHTEEYAKLIDPYMVRHIVKPGITGWAQINGYRGATDELWKMERRVEYDVWYIENWTFLLDLKIIGRTVINAFSGEKNAF